MVDPATTLRRRWRRGGAATAALAMVASALVGGAAPSTAAPAGTMTTEVGTTSGLSDGPGRVATAAQLKAPGAVAVDAAGRTYIADTQNCLIRRVDQAGLISDLAGTRGSCSPAADGVASETSLDRPVEVVIRPANAAQGIATDQIIFTEQSGCRVRMVADGAVRTIAGSTTCGNTGDGGAATAATLRSPSGLAVAANGDILVADTGNCRIRRIRLDGTILHVAGRADGTCGNGGTNVAAATAALNQPLAVAVHPANGSLVIADSGNYRVRRVSGTTITHLAGTGAPGNGADGQAPLSTALAYPVDVAVDAGTGVFVAEGLGCRVRRMASTMQTVAGSPPVNGQAVCGPASGDGGPATSAGMNTVTGVTATPSGDLAIVDRGNHRIRRVNAVSARTYSSLDTRLTDLWRTFANAGTGDRWTGGDATYSLKLPDNRILWLFADSYVDVARPDRTRPDGLFETNNQLVVQTSATSDTLRNVWRRNAAGTELKGQDFFPDKPNSDPNKPGKYFWPGAPSIDTRGTSSTSDDRVQVLLTRVDAANGHELDGVELATLSLPDLRVVSQVDITARAFSANATCTTSFTPSVVRWRNATYVHAVENCPDEWQTFAKVARVKNGSTDLAQPWEYWNGSAWVASQADADRIQYDRNGDGAGDVDFNTAGNEMSIVPRALAGDSLRMTATVIGIGQEIVQHTMPGPEGPVRNRTVVWQAPESGQAPYGADSTCELVPYNAKEHPALGTGSQVVISYNVNILRDSCSLTEGEDALEANVDNYRPRFIDTFPR